MKKLVATLLAGAMVFGIAAPTFAAEYDASADEKVTLVWSGNCVAADIHAQAMHVFAEKVEDIRSVKAFTLISGVISFVSQ